MKTSILISADWEDIVVNVLRIQSIRWVLIYYLVKYMKVTFLEPFGLII